MPTKRYRLAANLGKPKTDSTGRAEGLDVFYGSNAGPGSTYTRTQPYGEDLSEVLGGEFDSARARKRYQDALNALKVKRFGAGESPEDD